MSTRPDFCVACGASLQELPVDGAHCPACGASTRPAENGSDSARPVPETSPQPATRVAHANSPRASSPVDRQARGALQFGALLLFAVGLFNVAAFVHTAIRHSTLRGEAAGTVTHLDGELIRYQHRSGTGQRRSWVGSEYDVAWTFVSGGNPYSGEDHFYEDPGVEDGTITVYYDPANPADASARRADPSVGRLAIGLVSLLGMALCLRSLFRAD